MRKIIFLFLLSPLLVNAQDSISSPRLGFTFGATVATDVAIGWTPGISFSYGKHEAYASILVVNKLFNSPKTYTGFQCGYRFYPYGHKRRFSLLFGYDFDYFSASYRYAYPFSYYHPYPYSYTATEWQTRSLDIIMNYISFGFRANILRNLFITSNVGIGVGKLEEKFSERFPDGTDNVTPMYSLHFAPTLNACITYHFLSLKRK